MKKVFTSMFFLFWAFFSFAQSEKINCIIFVDGKLPMPGTIKSFVEYNNEFNQKDTVYAYYYIPTIEFKSTDFEELKSLPCTTDITIHILFQEYQKKYGYTWLHYSTPFDLTGLLNNTYIILSITNFDKKKGTYYFDYFTSTFQKGWSEGYNKKNKIFHDSNPYKPVKR
jgi:hypothetical protein